MIATRKACIPFLVPHRTEGGKDSDPFGLRRSAFGYPLQLNASFLDEVLGHLGGAAREYVFGPWVGLSLAEESQTDLPEGAGDNLRKLWADATLDGMSWRRFFDETVAEWFLSSPGGFVVCDNAKPMGDLVPPVSDPDSARPYVTFAPFSNMLDYRYGTGGFDQVKLLELHDMRDLNDPNLASRQADGDVRTEFEVLYRLVPAEEGAEIATSSTASSDGEVVAVAERRVLTDDTERQPVKDAVNYGTLLDQDGQPTLPLVPVRFKRHPTIPGLGRGFFMGLDDIILDAWNVQNETRAAYRDAMMSIDAIAGAQKEDMQKIAEMLQLNYRMIGIPENASVSKMGNDATEVTVGMELKKEAVKDWATAVKRRAGLVEGKASQSGISLQSEFAIDLNPILKYTAGWLDEIESSTLWVLAQLQGLDADMDTTISVTRNKDFRLEPEGGRIIRTMQEIADAGVELPDIVTERATKRIIETTEIAGKVDAELEAELDSALEDQRSQPRLVPQPGRTA